MGNKQVVVDQNLQNHDKFGQVKIGQMQDPLTGEKYETMQLVKTVDEKFLELWLKQIIRIDDSQIREVLILPIKHSFKKEGLCGSMGSVKLIYQKYSLILQNEIQNRRHITKFFLESQMWYILYNIIRAANKFQRIKIKIGDVHPSNILINQDGQIKLISVCSLPDERTNFDKLVDDKNINVFLAPQQLDERYINKGEYPKVDPCKSQVFSIGMTLLSCGTLENCDKIYQKKQNFRINKERLKILMDKFGQNYGVFLTQTVFGMLIQDQNNRKKSSQIYQMLLPYENQILQLQTFNPSFTNKPHPNSNNVQIFNRNQNIPYRPQTQTKNQLYSNPTRFTYARQ